MNSNALAAATAIGNALKTGTPIPRSNSLQRTSGLQRSSSIQRSSSLLGRQPGSRSGSLLGLQGPPSSFQQHAPAPQRSQSLTAGSAYQRSLNSKKSTSSLSSGPRMVKKHIPGPYGLVTIEVPAEESQKPKIKPKGSRSFTRASDRGSIRSFQTTSSQGSIPHIRRAVVNEPLNEVDEDIPDDFEQKEPLPHNGDFKNSEVPVPTSLTLIEEEDGHTNEVSNELNNLKLQKENEEQELKKTLESEEQTQQGLLNTKFNSSDHVPNVSSPAPTEIRDIKATIIDNEPIFNADGTLGEPESADLENEVLDEYTDAPSTARSNDTTTAGQSSFTTAVDSDNEQDHKVSSMAQQLRPTIPSLHVNNNKLNSEASQEITTQNGLSNTLSLDTAGSSLYSSESHERDGGFVQPMKNENGADLQIPERSSKRASSVSPRKSALKTKSSSTVNLHEDLSNPANAAYLSLTTAENTRLNALSSNDLTTPNVARNNTVRQSLRQEPTNGNFKTSLRSQQPQSNTRTTLRPQSQQPQQAPKVPAPHQMQKRPQSNVIPRYEQSNNRGPVRPASAQGFRPPPQAKGSPNVARHTNQQPQPQSPSNAAAMNAALKKAEKPGLVRTSSFEKDRPNETHAAFKRKSLRDPSINSHANIDSQLGFYRQQAAQQNHHNQLNHGQAHHSAQESNGHGFSGFRSRFDDSDDEGESVPTLRHKKAPSSNANTDFAPPPNNPALRKPRSQYTLRSASNSVIPEGTSPAKSLPEKRNTRYFSEADKEQLFNEHLKKAEAGVTEKKKSKFGGKLKKLFGRGNNN